VRDRCPRPRRRTEAGNRAQLALQALAEALELERLIAAAEVDDQSSRTPESPAPFCSAVSPAAHLATDDRVRVPNGV
jgi:hypothetical protein